MQEIGQKHDGFFFERRVGRISTVALLHYHSEFTSTTTDLLRVEDLINKRTKYFHFAGVDPATCAPS